MRKRTRGFVLAASLVATTLTGIVTATSADAACSSFTDIGYTVRSGNVVKGSGSYTSASGCPLKSVTVALQFSRNNGSWSTDASTKVTRYPKNGGGSAANVLTFSAKDRSLIYERDVADSCRWRAVITAKDTKGNSLPTKTSNVIYTEHWC